LTSSGESKEWKITIFTGVGFDVAIRRQNEGRFWTLKREVGILPGTEDVKIVTLKGNGYEITSPGNFKISYSNSKWPNTLGLHVKAQIYIFPFSIMKRNSRESTGKSYPSLTRNTR